MPAMVLHSQGVKWASVLADGVGSTVPRLCQVRVAVAGRIAVLVNLAVSLCNMTKDQVIASIAPYIAQPT